MRSLKTMSGIVVLSAMLMTTPCYAQGTAAAPPATAPSAQQRPTSPPAAQPQQPSATPPATAQPAPQPQPPRPFPEGSKIAFVDIQAIASLSVEGKAATAKLDDMRKKKNAELLGKNTALKSMQDKLTSGGSVMNDQARGQLEKDIEKAQRELQFAQQDAQTEVTDLTNQLQGEFQEKLNPIIEQIRVDKGLLMIFSIRDAGIVAVDLGLDLSNEVVKRFDASAKTPPAAPAKK